VKICDPESETDALRESPRVSWRLAGLESRRVDGRVVGMVGGLELRRRDVTDGAVHAVVVGNCLACSARSGCATGATVFWYT